MEVFQTFSGYGKHKILDLLDRKTDDPLLDMVSLSFAEFNVDCKRDAEVLGEWLYLFMLMPFGVNGKNDEGDVLGESRYLLGSTLIFSFTLPLVGALLELLLCAEWPEIEFCIESLFLWYEFSPVLLLHKPVL